VTLFRGNLVAAYALPPSTSSRARHAITIEGEGTSLLSLLIDPPSFVDLGWWEPYEPCL
jgi:hypothetical protein